MFGKLALLRRNPYPTAIPFLGSDAQNLLGSLEGFLRNAGLLGVVDDDLLRQFSASQFIAQEIDCLLFRATYIGVLVSLCVAENVPGRAFDGFAPQYARGRDFGMLASMPDDPISRLNAATGRASRRVLSMLRWLETGSWR